MLHMTKTRTLHLDMTTSTHLRSPKVRSFNLYFPNALCELFASFHQGNSFLHAAHRACPLQSFWNALFLVTEGKNSMASWRRWVTQN